MAIFTILGVVLSIFLVYKFLTALWMIVYPHILVKLLGHVVDLKTFGKWAVVTGATDGIGKGYAKGLAKRGVNVYLISRSEEKLKATADEIRKANPNVEVKTLSIDFQQANVNTYKTTIANAFKEIEIGILVNNVGMGYEYPEEITAIKNGEEFLQNIVLVNSVSALQLSRLVLPQMLARKKGVIINISSAAAFHAIPLMTVYSATKIFLDYVTSGLRTEYSNSGVIFQIVNPFYVKTKLSGITRTSFWAPDPDSYASNALDTIGILDATSGCLSHEIQRTGMKLLISIVPPARLGEQTKKTVLKLKTKFLRAQQRQQNKEK